MLTCRAQQVEEGGPAQGADNDGRQQQAANGAHVQAREREGHGAGTLLRGHRARDDVDNGGGGDGLPKPRDGPAVGGFEAEQQIIAGPYILFHCFWASDPGAGPQVTPTVQGATK